jgi:hypothetical protein
VAGSCIISATDVEGSLVDIMESQVGVGLEDERTTEMRANAFLIILQRNSSADRNSAYRRCSSRNGCSALLRLHAFLNPCWNAHGNEAPGCFMCQSCYTTNAMIA